MSGDKKASGITVTGTGEFEHRDRYVIATVEVSGGVIRSISFGTNEKAGTRVCNRLAEILTGKTISEALEISSGHILETCPEACETQAHEVLLEAFHRAVESCLDQ